MSELLELIRTRRSLRALDPARPVAPEALDAVLEAAQWTPTAHNMQNFEIVVVDDPAVFSALAEVNRAVSETFVRENYAMLSFSEDELLEKKTGMLADMFPPPWRQPDFRLDQFSEDELAAMARPVPPTPVLLVTLYDRSRRAPASEGDVLGTMSLGCLMENMWLAATSVGLGMHIISSLGAEDEIRTILRIPDRLGVAFACRIGYPAPNQPPVLRVRREVEDFTHHNRYDE